MCTPQGQQFVMVRDGVRNVSWYANEINYVIARVCRQCRLGFEIIVLPEAAEVQPGLKVVGSLQHHTPYECHIAPGLCARCSLLVVYIALPGISLKL